MSQLQLQPLTDTWVTSTWDEYLRVIDQPAFAAARGYYHTGKMRVELVPLGHDHAADNTVSSLTVNLYAGLRNIPVRGLINCSFRKTGYAEAQPDLAYYVGANADAIAWGTSVVDLDCSPPPDLVIEIANTSLADDKGEKRLLYEDLQVQEYWIVDVQNVQVIAFAIAQRGSHRIVESQVISGLAISLVQAALQRSRQTNQSEVVAWLLSQLQP